MSHSLENNRLMNSIKENSVIDNLITMAEKKEKSLQDMETDWSLEDNKLFKQLMNQVILLSHDIIGITFLVQAITKYNIFKTKYRRTYLTSVRNLELEYICDIKNATYYATSKAMIKINNLSETSYIEAIKKHSFIKPEIKVSRFRKRDKTNDDISE